MRTSRENLAALIARFRQSTAGLQVLPSETPIQIVMTPGNECTRRQAAILQEAGLDVRPILHPTVPKGQERLRIVLHSFNTPEEVDRCTQLLTANS